MERGREGDAFRQLTLGQNGDGGIKEGDCESSRLATCALTAQVVQAKENVDLEGLWADENCGHLDIYCVQYVLPSIGCRTH